MSRKITFTKFGKLSTLVSLEIAGKFRRRWKHNYKNGQPIGGSGLKIAKLCLKENQIFTTEKTELLYVIKCTICECKFIYVGYTGKGIKDLSTKSGRLGRHILKLLAINDSSGYHAKGWQETATSIHKYLCDNNITRRGQIAEFINSNIFISIGQLSDKSGIQRFELFVLDHFSKKYPRLSVLNDVNMQMHKANIVQKKTT